MKKYVGLFIVALAVSVLALTGSASAVSIPPTGQFLYFYIPPQDGTGVSTQASLNNFFILTHGDESYHTSLHQAGYTGAIHQYVLAAEVDGPGPYANSSAACDSSYAAWHNQAAMDAGDFCAYVHPNESWFLHNSRGERLYNLQGSHVFYQMNPGAAGWRQFFAQRALRELQGATNYPARGFDGLFLDNLWVDTYSLKNQKENSTGAMQEYASDSAYQAAMIGFLSQLKTTLTTATKTWPLTANFTSDQYSATSWDAYLPYLDGGMNECFTTDWGTSYPSTSEWITELQKAERVQAQGKLFIAVAQGAQTNTARMRFAYGSYLLTMQPGKAVFRYADSSDYESVWNYSDYWTDLGTPTGARVQQADGSWRRDFTRGYVVVNPATHATQIVQQTGATNTPAPSATATKTNTPAPSATATKTNTPAPSATATKTNTPAPSATATKTNTPAPSATATKTKTPVPSATATKTKTPVPSATATKTNTPAPSATPVSGKVVRTNDIKIGKLVNGTFKATFDFARGETVVVRYYVVDGSWARLAGATVTASVNRPDSTAYCQITAVSDSKGWAQGTCPVDTNAVLGVWDTQVANVTKTGYAFSRSGSTTGENFNIK